MSRTTFYSLLTMPAVLLLAACSHYIPAHDPQVQAGTSTQPVSVVQTVPPVVQTLPPSEQTIIIPSHRANTPVTTVVTPPVMAGSTSVLPMTLTGDLTPLQNQIRMAMPDSFNEAGHPLSSDFRWNFVRTGEPQVSIQNGIVTIRGEYAGSIESKNNSTMRACRLNPVYPVIEETANLDVKQLGNDAYLSMVNPQMRVWLKPESDQRCNPFNMPVQDEVRNLINADALQARMASSLEQSKMRIRSDFADRLRGPFVYSMQPANTQLCVYPNPQQVTVGRLEGDGRQATLRTVAVIQPTTAVGSPCPPPATTQPIPMRIGEVQTFPPAGQPVKIVSGVLLPYTRVSEILDSKVPNTEFELGNHGEKVRIERIVAQDAAGRVLLTAETSGYLKGPMYFWGTPQIQTLPNGQTALTIPDLQMDPETRRMLDKIDSGLGARADQLMTPRIRDAAYINMTDRITYVQRAVSNPYRDRDVAVTFQPVRLSPGNVYSTPNGLVTDVTMETTGNAEGKFYIIQG